MPFRSDSGRVLVTSQSRSGSIVLEAPSSDVRSRGSATISGNAYSFRDGSIILGSSEVVTKSKPPDEARLLIAEQWAEPVDSTISRRSSTSARRPKASVRCAA
jgi:hypothetical protein